MSNTRDIPKGRWFDLKFCGDCPNAHLIFYDHDDKPIAHVTLTAAQLRRMLKEVELVDPNFKEIEIDGS